MEYVIIYNCTFIKAARTITDRKRVTALINAEITWNPGFDTHLELGVSNKLFFFG